MLLLLLLGCPPPSDDTGAPADTAGTGGDTADTADSGDTADTAPVDTWVPTDCGDGAVTGTVTGQWSDGDAVALAVDGADGSFIRNCYGGYMTGPFEAVDGQFEWDLTVRDGAGAPELRPLRVVGCVTDTQVEVSVIEEDGTTFWGPHTLTPDPDFEMEWCD